MSHGTLPIATPPGYWRITWERSSGHSSAGEAAPLAEAAAAWSLSSPGSACPAVLLSAGAEAATGTGRDRQDFLESSRSEMCSTRIILSTTLVWKPGKELGALCGGLAAAGWLPRLRAGPTASPRPGGEQAVWERFEPREEDLLWWRTGQPSAAGEQDSEPPAGRLPKLGPRLTAPAGWLVSEQVRLRPDLCACSRRLLALLP